MNYLLINKENVLANYNYIKRKSNKNIIAVIKDNGYGFGAVAIAKILATTDVFMFAVSSVKEAVELRKNKIENQILIFGIVEYKDLKKCIKYNLTITINSLEWLKNLKYCQLDEQNNIQQIKCHLKINTGMNRYGLFEDEVSEALHLIYKNQLDLVGVYTHFLNSEDEFITKNQLDLFKRIVTDYNLTNLTKHCSNSYAALNYNDDFNDAVRVGIALYGLNRHLNNFDLLKSIFLFKVKVKKCFKVNEKTCIGYNCSYLSDKKGFIIVTEIGYSHGLLRNYQLTAKYLDKNLLKIANTCMDITEFFSETKIKENEYIDVYLDIDKNALINNMISYEVCVLLSSKLKRKII